nr:outer membrane beta-barrel protein [Pseudoalteromonas sp. C2R02]
MRTKLGSLKVKTCIKISLFAGVFCYTTHGTASSEIYLENGVVVKPLLNVVSKYDDNIYQQASDKQGDSILIVTPSIGLVFDDGLNQYKLDLGLSSGSYGKNSDDNYLDTEANLSAHFEPSNKHRFDLLASAFSQSEPRGTGVTEGTGSALPEPLTYKKHILGGKYEFGAMSSFTRIAFEAQSENKKYDNFRSISKYRDTSSIKFGSSLFYKMDSETDLFLDLSREDIKYDQIEDNTISRDSKDNRALLGVQWEMTSMTTGLAKLGYQNKSFVGSSRENFSGLSWEAQIQWQPLTYTNITFETSRAAKDPTTEGDYVNQSLYALNWNHNWNEKLRSSIGASFTTDVYTGIYRKDEILTGSFSISYLIQRWLEIGVFIEIKDNDSTTEIMSFDKNLAGLNFNISM